MSKRSRRTASPALPSGASDLVLYVNGDRHEVSEPQPEQTLLEFLRSIGLTGTKLGCAEGGCGACTVTVSDWDAASQSVRHRPVNACLAPVCSVDSCHITTVEGIGSVRGGMHPVQQRMSAAHGSQCGFCTPGIVMSLYTLLRKEPRPSEATLEHAFDGNLCRCTGYRPILDAAKSFADAPPAASAALAASGGPYDPETERSLDFLRDVPPRSLRVEGRRVTWFQPLELPELLQLKAEHPDAKLIVGNTEVGIETKFKHAEYAVQLAICRVPQLNLTEETDAGAVRVGGAVSLGALDAFLRGVIRTRAQPWQTRGFQAIVDMMRWFASKQIRSVAALAGNIATASPISDLNPMLIATGAVITLASLAKPSSGGAGGAVTPQYVTRDVHMSEFFVGYRKTQMKPSEIILHVTIPPTARWEYVLPYKQARRRDDDISIVCAGLRVALCPAGEGESGGWNVLDCCFAYGGMAALTKRAQAAMQACRGRAWCPDTVAAACNDIARDLPMLKNVPGGMPEFRQALARSFLFKFFVASAKALAEDIDACRAEARADGPSAMGDVELPNAPAVDAREASAAITFVTAPAPVSRGTQYWGDEEGGLQRARPVPHAADDGKGFEGALAAACGGQRAPVGAPTMHKSARLQVTGEAKYTDDLPVTPGSLHAALVLSTQPHARIVSVDAAPARGVQGFAGFFSAGDVANNAIGAVIKDEQVFRDECVRAVGQPIGVVVADTVANAQRAARAVKIEYGAEDSAPVFSVEDAIRAESFFDDHHAIERGDAAKALADAAADTENSVVVEGEMRIGGQEHFYLECNATVCIPGEGDDMQVISSTQNPSKTQKFVAHVLGVPANGVVCRIKRMGGGFGGKETRSVFIACAAAVAARKLGREVRINIDRDQDMSITGARHAFVCKYRAAAARDGSLLALEADLYCNGGYSLDLSSAVTDRALFHSDNTYNFPSVTVRGHICRTNTSSNTAFRGFGGPQGMMMTEAVIDHVARALRVAPERVRSQNLYREAGAVTPFGQALLACPIRRMWGELAQRASFDERRQAVEEFNRCHKWRKRGLCMMPNKFGINFTAKFMNQGGALVHVYQDGTVLVSHGGTEMGQGLHTKMAQIAARCFGIDVSAVTVTETATDKVANSNPTAASMSTDLYGMATLDACEKIRERLAPVAARLGEGKSFADLATAAFFDRVDLSAHGFYTVPGDRCGYDWGMDAQGDNARRGMPFNYFTYGVSCSEVELDTLTGDILLRRADILMDLGYSINPALDIGQIEGAFVQGFGWCTMEELVWGDADHPWVSPGRLFTCGPGTYKIPSFNDVPLDMRVHLLEKTPNPFAVHSSKAVGEPPLFLAASAFYATKEAIYAARAEHGHEEGHVPVDSPLTAERARVACGDRFVSAVGENCGERGGAAALRPRGSW